MNLTVKELIEVCNGEICLQTSDSEQKVTSVVIDSRRVTKNGVFFATVGAKVDGHSFISQVFEQGAILVVGTKRPEEICREYGSSTDGWKNYVVVADVFGTLKAVAEYYRQKLTIPVVGITGSVGKTSTKEFIAGVLSQKFNVLKTEGNYNNEIGVPLTLLRITEETEAAVVEMGISDFGEMHRLSKMARPTICVMTNIGQCHLEKLGDRDGVLRAKSEIFDFMAEDGIVCVNRDDDKLCHNPYAKDKTVLGFGLSSGDSFATNIVSRGLWGSDATIHLKGTEGFEEIEVSVPLPGRHMVINATAAALVGQVLGLSTNEIANGIRSVAAISGRNNLIPLGKLTLIDDCYNANPASMRAALDLLQMADNRKIAILGDMFELGENSDECHAQIGAYAVESGVDCLICIGANAAHMYRSACQKVEEQKASPTLRYFETREQFLKALQEQGNTLLPEESTVLLKASHGMKFTEILDTLRNPRA